LVLRAKVADRDHAFFAFFRGRCAARAGKEPTFLRRWCAWS